MNYSATFSGWNKLSIEDLLVAYRKAKADCFFESCFPIAIKFAEYEQDLLKNLTELLEQLKSNLGFSEIETLLGDCRLLPKKLSPKEIKGKKNGHTHFSDPERAFQHLHSTNNLIPEFRIVGDFPVDTHIISALWINMVGHKFDACLDDKQVYGSRLKRIRNEDELDKKAQKPFHITAIGSFPPYFNKYQQWRNDGLKAIRSELEQERPVIAVSLDLKSYYHLIDPSFISTEEFQKEIGLDKENKLTEHEANFTEQLAKMLSRWSDKAGLFAQGLQDTKKIAINGGLVIGLTASRIIANVLLHKWDRLIKEKITPIHYGRYVDDMFLVLHDPGSNVINDTSSFMIFLKERLGGAVLTNGLGKKNDIWTINFEKEYQKKSKIQLQGDKQKLFILDGQAGYDLLDSIEKEIRNLSSEHRLMPAPDQLEHTTAAKVLSAAGSVGDPADTLGRADGLTIRRLSWSLQLRHVETLAHDLPAYEWKKEREEFYDFAYNHVLRADKIFEQYQYIPRLLGFSINLEDWDQAESIVKKSLKALNDLSKQVKSKMVINGVKCYVTLGIWSYVEDSITCAFIDAAARYYPVRFLNGDKPTGKACKLEKKFIFDSEDFHVKASLLAKADLAKIPYKDLFITISSDVVKGYSLSFKKRDDLVIHTFNSSNLLSLEYLWKFLKASQARRLGKNKKWKREPILPFLFPTRPYSPEEITELVPGCIDSSKLWAKYVRALRGVWVNPTLLEGTDKIKGKSQNESKLPTKIIGNGNKKVKKVTVAISNLATEYECWEATACNTPLLSLERYKRLSDLVNQTIQLKPRPQYLLLPEVSLPLKWVSSISNRLQNAGINLIASTEYRHIGENEVYSEACLILNDSRLGYESTVRIWQPKLEPAVGEDKNLISKYGKKWFDFKKAGFPVQKPVYNHNGFCFGVMICSELLNSKARIDFQGEVDALLVLAWNKDLETFSALIESSALDIHAYIVLVNNRNYGDSRVRVPAKESFNRDLARLRGGENDYCVVVELDIEKLRAFQSRSKRWTEKDDPFKTTPEGFEISSTRRYLPPR